MQSRFRAWATVKTGCTGKSQAHRKIETADMTDVTGRLQATVGQELGIQHRYIFPRKASLATVLDEDDANDLDLAVAPTGEIITQHAAAAMRKLDDIFLAGIMGTNYEGLEDSMSSVSVTNTVDVHYDRLGGGNESGLTLAKLLQAKGLLAKAEVYGQNQKDSGAKLCMAVTQEQLDDLMQLSTNVVGSIDYNRVRALVEGEVDYFCGINFIRTERLASKTEDGHLMVVCPMWVSTGVHLDFWYDVKTSIDVLPTVSQAIQVYSRIKAGACRKSESDVILVECHTHV